MHCEIIVNVNPFETRIAIIEDHKLVELFAERKEQQVVIGNIYKGIISNVLPGMGAAFIDIGLSRAAFLHYRDISTSSVPKAKQKLFLKGDSSNIGKILSVGQERKDKDILLTIHQYQLRQLVYFLQNHTLSP